MYIEPPRSVFILKPSSFGDIIHTLPAVARLKAHWPAAQLSWMVNSEWTPLLEANPDLDEVITFPRHEFRGLGGMVRFLRWQRQQVRHRRPDLVLDFQGLLRTAVIGRLSAPRTFYGMADAREGARWFYDRAAPVPGGIPHSVERYLSLADFALHRHDANVGPSSTPAGRFFLPPGEPLDTRDTDRLENDFILLHPFARGQGKSLSVEHVEEFCRRLAPRQVVLAGRMTGSTNRTPIGCLNLLDRTTLGQLIWTLRRAAFVVSVDSGPVHLAAALGKPLVAIHTWSDPRRVGPYHPDAWVSKSSQLIRMQDMPAIKPAFFDTPPLELSASQISAICALATSSSNSSA